VKKGRLLTLWIAFAGFAYVSASQDWFTLSMNPNGDKVVLSNYDGLTTYPNLSALLMLNFAALLAVAFVGTWARKIITALVSALNVVTLVWVFTRIQVQDVSALAKQVEQLTGIAAVHGIKNITTATQNSPYLFLGGLALLIATQVLVLLGESKWPKRESKTELPKAANKVEEPKDAIGIWDSQRR
jgi:uncharacterized membrane protein (TIGR02234 family)